MITESGIVQSEREKMGLLRKAWKAPAGSPDNGRQVTHRPHVNKKAIWSVCDQGERSQTEVVKSSRFQKRFLAEANPLKYSWISPQDQFLDPTQISFYLSSNPMKKQTVN